MSKCTLEANGHSAGCNERTDAYERELERFETLYPHYCRPCGAVGGFYSTYDPSPAGVSLGSGYLTDFDPCSHCIEEGRCPRCAAQDSMDEENTRCEVCGWKCEDATCIAPQPYECDCWELSEDEEEALRRELEAARALWSEQESIDAVNSYIGFE